MSPRCTGVRLTSVRDLLIRTLPYPKLLPVIVTMAKRDRGGNYRKVRCATRPDGAAEHPAIRGWTPDVERWPPSLWTYRGDVIALWTDMTARNAPSAEGLHDRIESLRVLLYEALAQWPQGEQELRRCAEALNQAQEHGLKLLATSPARKSRST